MNLSEIFSEINLKYVITCDYIDRIQTKIPTIWSADEILFKPKFKEFYQEDDVAP